MYPFGIMVLLAGVAVLLRSTASGGEDILGADGEGCDYSGAVLECHESDESSGGRKKMVSLA